MHREVKKQEDENQKWNFHEINPVKKYFNTTTHHNTENNGEDKKGINEPKKVWK